MELAADKTVNLTISLTREVDVAASVAVLVEEELNSSKSLQAQEASGATLKTVVPHSES